jgi:hypothetical protein
MSIANRGERNRRLQMARTALNTLSALAFSLATIGGTLALFATQAGTLAA